MGRSWRGREIQNRQASPELEAGLYSTSRTPEPFLLHSNIDKTPGYGILYESEQLTRDLILAYLPTRGEWASAHSLVTSLSMHTALWSAPAIAQAVAANKKNRIELEYRADSVRLCRDRDTRRDYVDNWSLWYNYLDEKEKLLVPGGPVSGLVLRVWKIMELTEETANLFQEFYDLEHARQCHEFCESSGETDGHSPPPPPFFFPNPHKCKW